jgi:E3 ubiquitin-protein ligase MYCBP2
VEAERRAPKCRFCAAPLLAPASSAARTSALAALFAANAEVDRQRRELAESIESLTAAGAARRRLAAAPELAVAEGAVEAASRALQLSRSVCTAPECAKHGPIACLRPRLCGHKCGGVAGEALGALGCPPCLAVGADGRTCGEGDDGAGAAAGGGGGGGGGSSSSSSSSFAPSAAPATFSLPSGEDLCSICYVDSLNAAPHLRLSCGHFFHAACAQKKVASGYAGARITFGFLSCPNCKVDMAHPFLDDARAPSERLRAQVRSLASERLIQFPVKNDPTASALVKDHYKGDALAYAMDRFAFFCCDKCREPFFGGMRECGLGDEAAAAEEGGAGGGGGGAGGGGGGGGGAAAAAGGGGGGAGGQRLCPRCQPPPPGATICATHGQEAMLWKCRFCCNVALWFCFGTTHFCEDCA